MRSSFQKPLYATPSCLGQMLVPVRRPLFIPPDVLGALAGKVSSVSASMAVWRERRHEMEHAVYISLRDREEE